MKSVRLIKLLFGVFCILFGIAGLILPIAPGIFLIIIGLELLGLGFLIPEVARREFRKGHQKIKAKLSRSR